MSWTYADGPSQSTVPLRLTRLRLHMAEVANQIGNERSGDGYSKGSGSLAQYYQGLVNQAQRLESMPGASGGGAVSNLRIVRRGRGIL
jgi:hypothetical protein